MPYKRKTNGYCVYRITAPDGRVYIGTTCRDPRERWNSGHGYFNNEALFKDIRAFGWAAFKKEILFDGLSKESAYEKETDLIKAHESTNPSKGFNHTASGQAGGVIGHTLSAFAREKCAAAKRGTHLGSKSPRARKVNQYTIDGAFIKTWGATTEVQRALGINYTSIVKCCTGVYQTAGGYIWQYAETV